LDVGLLARFAFRWDPAYRAAALPFGVTPGRAWVDIKEGRLVARFGPWRLSTPLSNVARSEITGPYAFIKTGGPARLAITDRGLTFATNGERGLRIDFIEPVPGLEPTRRLRHPELTVTVEDLEGLSAALDRRVASERSVSGM
jgi:hypothetical protein